MGKSNNYKQELDRLMVETEKLEEKAKLDLETAEFFDREARKLEAIADDPNISLTERESAMTKMDILLARIDRELTQGDDTLFALNRNMTKLVKIMGKELL